jgi:hypothetical protein
MITSPKEPGSVRLHLLSALNRLLALLLPFQSKNSSGTLSFSLLVKALSTKDALRHNYAPYLGAFQTLNATSCRKRSASIARFPPHCSLHYKAKLAIHIHNSQLEEERKWKYLIVDENNIALLKFRIITVQSYI